ncbi:MAG: ATP-binding protein [Candidatus Aenigmarchaeota archaeon]|nr:ATP-binding protein [Candidatus Aenigmarchaeota archaeon]
MVQFINRERELEFLEGRCRSGEAELIVLYGRRRVGKTELIRRFGEGWKMMYFLGRLEAREETLRRFSSTLAESFGDSRLMSNPLRDWDAAFEYLAEKSAQRVVLAIDEFPFMAERFPEIVSVLQDKWDNRLKSSMLMLILSGSSVGMMEKHALDYKSPLYGRRTGQWKLDKMGIGHLGAFFPGYGMEDIVRLFACLDAIPGYLVKFSPDKSIADNIRERMLSKGEFLYEEVEILMREELRDPSNYMTILASVAGGVSSFGEICSRSRLEKSLVSKYLHVLERLGIVEKRLPITATAKAVLKSSGALYSMKDNFFDFWFRFVYPNRQELERGAARQVSEAIMPDFERYVSRKFEDFAAEFVSLGHAGTFGRVGKWWGKSREGNIMEIDVAAVNEKSGNALFGECKWQRGVNALKVAEALAGKVEAAAPRAGKVTLAIFAKSFSKRVAKLEGRRVLCFDLKDMERALSARAKKRC